MQTFVEWLEIYDPQLIAELEEFYGEGILQDLGRSKWVRGAALGAGLLGAGMGLGRMGSTPQGTPQEPAAITQQAEEGGSMRDEWLKAFRHHRERLKIPQAKVQAAKEMDAKYGTKWHQDAEIAKYSPGTFGIRGGGRGAFGGSGGGGDFGGGAGNEIEDKESISSSADKFFGR